MDHSTLEIFCAVAEELSITRAAQRLGRVQSNVTTRVQQLEEELGVTLFVRENKRMQLSPQGEKFLGYAKGMLALAEEARQILRPGQPEGLLRIGAMESTVASRLPEPLARYHQMWPRVQLRLSTAPSRQLVDALKDRTLDCAFAALPLSTGETPQDLAELGLTGLRVYTEQLVLVLPPDHPPVRAASELRIHSLAAFKQGCTYRSIAEDWLRSQPSDAVIDVQEVGSYHAMLACVASGSCISFIPRSVIELARETTRFRQKPIGNADTWMIWRNGYETPALNAFREALALAHD
ncbi:LysR family transcriptional regulator [Paraburkholderia acidicola]|uniref:LysR family transcriptional regulator n=1 Tax=Paraburkholderia acidicola TaxID=1912599 RepID=A0A2A4ERC9_9BURK|nr:LysR family transcriptional regulator [Paraburkholderia acidicola]PCE23405.1 LysR family transcriptional regulator [Paraburkholderia acidicola]